MECHKGFERCSHCVNTKWPPCRRHEHEGQGAKGFFLERPSTTKWAKELKPRNPFVTFGERIVGSCDFWLFLLCSLEWEDTNKIFKTGYICIHQRVNGSERLGFQGQKYAMKFREVQTDRRVWSSAVSVYGKKQWSSCSDGLASTYGRCMICALFVHKGQLCFTALRLEHHRYLAKPRNL